MLLDCVHFWPKVELIHELLKPIAKWTTYFEANTDVISKVVDCFRELQLSFGQQISKNPSDITMRSLKDILESRYKKCVRPIHFLANILEPVNREKNLSAEESILATEIFFKICSNHVSYKSERDIIIQSFAEYKSKQQFFGKQFVVDSEKLSGRLFWSGICSRSKMSQIAIDILTMPASSAATERTFST